MSSFEMFPECQPYHHQLLQVDDKHQLYIEECGNPQGIPVVFLHGGPGSGCNPGQRRFFDPEVYRIILFDQRGCGRSLPAGEVRNNSTDLLVEDIECIRQHLDIDRWHVFGGSWGSTLALAYSTRHAAKVCSLVLRGIFLSRPHEIDWFLGQVSLFFPEAWQALIAGTPADAHEDILSYYEPLVFHDDPAISIPAAIRWNAFESSIMSLHPRSDSSQTPGEVELARARVQIHYIRNHCFVDGADMLTLAATQLANIPTIIVQGRYDMVCPPQTAWALKNHLPHAQLIMVPDAGHSAMEPGTCQALLQATAQMQQYR